MEEAKPSSTVLGVYRIDVTEQLIAEQAAILCRGMQGSAREGCVRSCRDQLYDAVLVEIIVEGRDNRFSIGDFGQPHEDQVAWAEAYLTLDGESLAVPRWSDCPEMEPIRIAFFIHCWDRRAPLETSYGPVMCPQPVPMPERLGRLVPYELLD